MEALVTISPPVGGHEDQRSAIQRARDKAAYAIGERLSIIAPVHDFFLRTTCTASRVSAFVFRNYPISPCQGKRRAAMAPGRLSVSQGTVRHYAARMYRLLLGKCVIHRSIIRRKPLPRWNYSWLLMRTGRSYRTYTQR